MGKQYHSLSQGGKSSFQQRLDIIFQCFRHWIRLSVLTVFYSSYESLLFCLLDFWLIWKHLPSGHLYPFLGPQTSELERTSEFSWSNPFFVAPYRWENQHPSQIARLWWRGAQEPDLQGSLHCWPRYGAIVSEQYDSLPFSCICILWYLNKYCICIPHSLTSE